jgi:hypothetical protein
VNCATLIKNDVSQQFAVHFDTQVFATVKTAVKHCALTYQTTDGFETVCGYESG